MSHAIDLSAYQRAAAVVIEASRWLRMRFAMSQYQALHGLDAVTLKDIGLDRSEISSVDAELYSGALRTRRNLVCE